MVQWKYVAVKDQIFKSTPEGSHVYRICAARGIMDQQNIFAARDQMNQQNIFAARDQMVQWKNVAVRDQMDQ